MRDRNTRAFTLIEILVVIAVISVLLLLIIWGSRKAVSSAQSTQCRSNLRLQGSALVMFAMDNEGLVILNVYGNSTSPSTRRWADYILGTMSSNWDGRKFPGIDYTNGNKESARCPAEDREFSFSTGHAYGAMLVPNEDDPYTIAPQDLVDLDNLKGSLRIHAIQLSTMDDAANYWLLADSWSEGYNRQIYIIRNRAIGESSKIHLRHNHQANMLFADGSVRAMGPKDLLRLRYNSIPYGYDENYKSIAFEDEE